MFRVLPKLNAEEDAHLGPGGPANAKRGTVDVHRGGRLLAHSRQLPHTNEADADTYQFGYFLRKTDPHAVLVKVRLALCVASGWITSRALPDTIFRPCAGASTDGYAT